MPHRYGAPADDRKRHLIDPLVRTTGTACGLALGVRVLTTRDLEETTCKRCLAATL